MADAQPLIDLSVDEIRHRVFTRQEELGDLERLPLKVIHYNRSPAVAPATFLKDEAVVKRLGLDGAVCRHNLAMIKGHTELAAKLSSVFMQEERPILKDPDVMLYSGGFFSREDKARMETIRSTPPHALSELAMSFDDRRLPEMLMRYIGRNYPEQLSEQQRMEWEEYRQIRLLEKDGGGSITMDQYFDRLNHIAQTPDLPAMKQIMLQDLADYAQSIYPIAL